MQKIGLALVCLLALSGVGLAADVKVKTYEITGTTGLELYHSIGRNGPNNSASQGAIAQTVPQLKWNRLFDERKGDCHLVSLKPSLSITMILPEPKNDLPAGLKADWQLFIDGVRKHEDVHVEMIHRMVAETKESAAGAWVANDRSCAKVKAEVSRRIDEAMANHRARSRAYDREDLGPSGNVQRLVLDLVKAGR